MAREKFSIPLKNLLLFLISCLCLSVAFGQSKNYTFKVMDVKNNSIPFASIRVTSVLDSLKQFSLIADSNGIASANISPNKNYTLLVNAIGYKKYSKTIALENNSNITIKLLEDPTQLNQVVVTSSKALVRQEDDKAVVDPELLAAGSTNAMETIEKTPGVFIDSDGNIFLNGLSPAGVQINGRDLRMSPSDLATLLKSLPPNAIQKIELIRTPSAKYDASGGGGLVNIVLKKGVKLGLNGSMNTGLNQGQYGNQFLGVNLNNTNDKYNTYLNTQYNNNNGYSINNTNRILNDQSTIVQRARTQNPSNSFYVGYGIGRNYKEKWEFNYDGRISNNQFNNTTKNNAGIVSANALPALNESIINNKGSNYNINQSFRSKYKLDTVGGEWVTDVSVNYSEASTRQEYSNQFRNTVASSGAGDFGNDRTIFIAQTDLKKKWRGFNWETGIKTSILQFDNHAKYVKTIGGITIPDEFRTSSYSFKEQVNAGYLQASKNWGAIILKLGTRVEQTIMQGRQFIPKDTSFLVNRTDAFPYVYLSRKLVTIMGYEMRGYLVYRKTISRPSYDFLNPFARYIDPYNYEIGNPLLKPQFTTNYEANISVDDRPIFAYGVNETKDIFSSVVYTSPIDKELSYRTYDNLGKNKEVYFRAIGVIPPGKKYFAVVGVQYSRNIYNGIYENQPFNFDRGSYTFFTFQSYKLDTKSTIAINGFWRTNGQQQFYELDNFGQLNATINRQFLNKKLTVTLSANDIFFTNNNNFVLNQGSIRSNGYRENDTRRYGINLRYNFGFKPKEKKLDMLDNDPIDK